MLKNIHPSQISFNKARKYYLHLEIQGCKYVNILPLKKMYEIQLFRIIDSPPLNYTFSFTFNCNKENGCHIRFIPSLGKYILLCFTSKNNNKLDEFLNEFMLSGERNIIINMSENYKLITMLICNRYNKNNDTNKVLSDKYLMRFIASYL